MVERTRAHARLVPRDIAGTAHELGGILPRPVSLFVPPLAPDTLRRAPVLVHFLGPAFIAQDAANRMDARMVVATVNLSPGSSAYEQPFRRTDAWPRLLRGIDSVLSGLTSGRVSAGPVYLSAFSAGNGAVRAIVANAAWSRALAGVLVLDGIHAGYDPPGRVVADGGRLDPSNLEALLVLARRAVAGDLRLVVTHSEVFPGTFASTTETADWLLAALGLTRTGVLAWGPNGMQQLSEARAGGFALMGFAGNSAPDHLDHLHALPTWLPLLAGARAPASGRQ